MNYKIYGHRNADFLFANKEEFQDLYDGLLNQLDLISDEEIIKEFETEKREAKSISQALNRIIKRRLTEIGWAAESYIFADSEYGKNAKGVWRLDFATEILSVEVAFNHRSDISWNLIKPTLASELNHVQKNFQTQGGIIICATQELKAAGGFDSAVGTYEDYVQYCKPLYEMLSSPLAIVGLKAPETFRIEVEAVSPNKKVGKVIRF